MLEEEEKRYLYLQVQKTWYRDCRLAPKREIISQKRKRLERKRTLKDDKEQSDMTKRNQFTMHECIPLYTSMCDLNNELASMFPAAIGVPARPKYSTALRTAIVREQLNVRKWVYGRKIAEGDLCSSMADGNETKIRHLTATLAAIMEDERRVPPKKRHPKIRADYVVGPNPTSFRKLLDAERNAATKALEAQFVREHPGSVFQGDDFPLFLMSLCMSSFIGLFRLYELSIYVCLLTTETGHRCLYDYGKGCPENPEAILQQRVAKVFPDGITYHGEIVAYNIQHKWWKVEYVEDGDKEDLNFRQLCKLDTAPDFSVFRYSPEGDPAL